MVNIVHNRSSDFTCFVVGSSDFVLLVVGSSDFVLLVIGSSTSVVHHTSVTDSAKLQGGVSTFVTLLTRLTKTAKSHCFPVRFWVGPVAVADT